MRVQSAGSICFDRHGRRLQHPGRGDQGVDAADQLLGSRDQRAHLRLAGDVAAHEVRGAAGRGNRLDRPFRIRNVDVGHDHRRGRRAGDGDGAADAGRASGEQQPLAELHGSSPAARSTPAAARTR